MAQHHVLYSQTSNSRIYEGARLRGNEVEQGGKTLSLKEEDTS